MIKLSSFFLAAILCSVAVPTLRAQQVNPFNETRPGPHPTRLIAKVKPQINSSAKASTILSQHGLAVRKQFRYSSGLVLLDETAGEAQAMANATPQDRKLKLLARLNALRQSGLFEFVEPD